jgi:hypothetical protein
VGVGSDLAWNGEVCLLLPLLTMLYFHDIPQGSMRPGQFVLVFGTLVAEGWEVVLALACRPIIRAMGC